MAASRSRRHNAGARMASLLDEEEKAVMGNDDEFYSTAYGGFTEESEDDDFAFRLPAAVRMAKAKHLLKKRMATSKESGEFQLSQADLLDEVDIASPRNYEQTEAEAKLKAPKLTRKHIAGPFIRYLSTTMPVVQPSKPSPTSDEDIPVPGSAGESASTIEVEETGEITPTSAIPDRQRQRDFLVFSDFDSFREAFPLGEPRQPRQKICPITKKPAKYFDPVTRYPYANLHAFKILREKYYTELEARGDKDDPEVAAWLEWRKKQKTLKVALASSAKSKPAALSKPLARSRLTVSLSALSSGAAVSSQPKNLRLGPGATAGSARTTSPLTNVQRQQQSRTLLFPARRNPLLLNNQAIPPEAKATTTTAGRRRQSTVATCPTGIVSKTPPVKMEGRVAASVGNAAGSVFRPRGMPTATTASATSSTTTTTTLTVQQYRQLTASRIDAGGQTSTPQQIALPQITTTVVPSRGAVAQLRKKQPTIVLQRPAAAASVVSIAATRGVVQAGVSGGAQRSLSMPPATRSVLLGQSGNLPLRQLPNDFLAAAGTGQHARVAAIMPKIARNTQAAARGGGREQAAVASSPAHLFINLQRPK